MEIPFTRDRQLLTQLETNTDANGKVMLRVVPPGGDWLPGNPAMPLSSPRLVSYLFSELETPKLNKMYPYLWLVATRNSAHVSALHEQLARGRAIVITENPELHLVWVEDRVFVKPLPPFLLSYDFWSLHLAAPTSPQKASCDSSVFDLRQAALGYLRTYFYLIQHESDFRIAQREHLIPSNVDFRSFITFISGFGGVSDTAVSLRHNYGQLRLTRLNFWARFALGQWVFYKVSWQYAEIFARYYAPILFVFGVLSVILSAMQVGSQARPEWAAFLGVSAWFSVISLLVVGLITVTLLAVLAAMLLRELIFALKQ